MFFLNNKIVQWHSTINNKTKHTRKAKKKKDLKDPYAKLNVRDCKYSLFSFQCFGIENDSILLLLLF